MSIQIVEIPNHQNKVRLRVAHGHFATSHSHINYYIDLTMTKHRLSEARIAAEELCGMYKNSTIVDSILCLDVRHVQEFHDRGLHPLPGRNGGAGRLHGFSTVRGRVPEHECAPDDLRCDSGTYLRKPADLPGQYCSDDCGQANIPPEAS